MAKLLHAALVLILLSICTNTITHASATGCAAYSSSLQPTTTIFSLQNLASEYEIEYNWIHTEGDKVKVSVDLCGGDDGFIFNLDNKNGAETFTIKNENPPPTSTPSPSPTQGPTGPTSKAATKAPTKAATKAPTKAATPTNPSTKPTNSPSNPTNSPSNPTNAPSKTPTKAANPTNSPTKPTQTDTPSNPTDTPTDSPTTRPTTSSSTDPTHAPTDLPTDLPTYSPTNTPTNSPTNSPTTPTSTTIGDNRQVGQGTTSSAKRYLPSTFLSIAIVALTALVLPRNRLGFVMLCIVLVVLYTPTITRASTTQKLVVSIALPASIDTVCIGNECFNKSTYIDGYVSIFGHNFATLDAVYDGATCNESRIMRLPSGWKIADANEYSLLAIYLRNLDTWGVAVANGSAYENLKHNAKLTDDAFITHPNYFDAGIHGYQVRFCEYRILITAIYPIANVTVVNEVCVEPAITNFITFDGYDYAAADNTPYSQTTMGCQELATYIDRNNEWQVAPDNGAARIVSHGLATTFGTDCIVVGSGSSFRADLSACSTSSLRSISFANGTVYTIDVCYKRILLRRPTHSNVNSWNTTVDITNIYYATNGIEFATLDNVDPRDTAVSDCQKRFLPLPAGWSIASSHQLTQFVAAEGWSAWPTTYCYVVNGAGLDHNGASCPSQLRSYTVNGVTYYNSHTCGRILLTKPDGKRSDFQISMKLLLVSVGTDNDAEVGLLLAHTMLNATGVPYDWINLLDASRNPNYPGDLPLVDNAGNPKYYGIIFTDSQLSYEHAPSQWKTALTDRQKTQLATYRHAYSVRLVALSAYPTASFMTVQTTGSAPHNTHLVIDSVYANANAAVFAGVNTAASFNITGLYRVAVNITDASKATPILRYVTSGTATPTSSSPIAAAILTNADGSEDMQFYVGNSIYLSHGPVLASVWIKWVTRGIYVGSRRVLLSAQVDDLFLGTEEFNNEQVVLRVAGSDMRKLKTFFDTMVAPAGSNITAEMAFNADGVKIPANGVITDELYTTCKELRDYFLWESHTYTHLDLTCPESDCPTYGNTTYAQAHDELFKNIEFTKNHLFADTGLDGATFSRYSMVTPRITGLFNYRSLNAMHDNGIYSAVGDNSRAELIPANLYHGIRTNVETHGREGIFIIPRFPTEIYYDCAYPAAQVEQYNYRYGPGGIFTGGFDFNSTLDDIMQREAERTARYLMQFRHDPYMFHQANMLHFAYTKKGDTSSKQWSLLSLWIQSVVDEYMRFMNLPVITLKQDAIWKVYEQRMARDECGAAATMTVSNGKVTGVSVTSSGSCELGVTGLNTCDGASGCRVEHYGDDVTVWAQLSSNAKSLQGPASVWIA